MSTWLIIFIVYILGCVFNFWMTGKITKNYYRTRPVPSKETLKKDRLIDLILSISSWFGVMALLFGSVCYYAGDED